MSRGGHTRQLLRQLDRAFRSNNGPLSHYLQILCRISILTTRVDHFFRNLAYHRNLDMLLRCCLPQLTVLYSTVRVCVQMQRKRWWFLNLQILCWISILTTRVNHFLCNLANHRNLDMLLRCCLPQLTVLYSTVRVCVQMQRKRWWFLNLQILKIQRFFRKNPH